MALPAIALVALATAKGDPAAPPAPAWNALAFLAFVPALVTSGIAPGLLCLGRNLRDDGFARLGAAIVLSALVTAVVGMAFVLAGRPLAEAGRAVALLVAATSVALAWFTARRTPERNPARARHDIRAIGLVAVCACVVFALYAANPFLCLRVDGWFHTAVTERLATGGLPLEDPYYAGLPLHYAWAFHALLGATTALAPVGAGVPGALAGWSVLAIVAVTSLFVALGRAWATNGAMSAPGFVRRAGAAVPVVGVLGVNPFGWLAWLARGLGGADRGWPELVRPLEGGAAETMMALGWHYPHASLATFADKFLTPTAFGLGYAAFLTAAYLLIVRPSRANAVFGALAAVTAMLLHTLAGFGLVVALGAASAWLLLRTETRRSGALALGSLCAACALAAPYVASILRGRAAGSGARFGFAPDMAWALGATGAVILGLALVEARTPLADAAARAQRAAWFVACGVLVVLALGTQLVQRNETKFANLALVALAVPAGAALARLPRRAAIPLALAFVPTQALAVAGFALDSGADTPGARIPGAATRAVCEELRSPAAANAAILEAQSADARDPVRDVLVHGPRSLVWGGDSYAKNWGHDPAELGWRKRAAAELAGGRLSDDAIAHLRRWSAANGGRPLYVVLRPASARPADAPGDSTAFTCIHADRDVSVFSLVPEATR